MTKPKYKYQLVERAQDTRYFTIESDRKLSKEELKEIGWDSTLIQGKKEKGIIEGTSVTFNETIYGPDSDFDSWEITDESKS